MGIRAKTTHALRYFLLRRLPTCKQMVALMSESMERRLCVRERALLRMHLWICAWCAWYLEQIHTLRVALRTRGAQAADERATEATLTAEARERIRRALNNPS